MVRAKHDDVRIALVQLIHANGDEVTNENGMLAQELALALNVDVKLVHDNLYKLRRKGVLGLQNRNGHSYQVILFDDWEQKMAEYYGYGSAPQPAVEEPAVLDLREPPVHQEEEEEEEDDIGALARAMITEAASALVRCEEAEKILDRFTMLAEENATMTAKIGYLEQQLAQANESIERLKKPPSNPDTNTQQRIQELQNSLVIERNHIAELEKQLKMNARGPARRTGSTIAERISDQELHDLAKLMRELPTRRSQHDG